MNMKIENRKMKKMKKSKMKKEKTFLKLEPCEEGGGRGANSSK